MNGFLSSVKRQSGIVGVIILLVYLFSGGISLEGIAILVVVVIAALVSLIAGRRKTEHRVGYVAEVCPQCAAPRTVEVSRVGMTQSVFGMSVGQGELLGFSGTCLTCAAEFDVQATDYQAYEASAPALPPIARTNPKLEPGNDIAQAEYVRHGLIRAEFLKASQSMAERYGVGTQIDRLDIPTLLAFALACGGPIWLGFAYPATPLWMDAAVFAAAFPVAVFVLYREPNRYFSNKTLPALARALVPLKPQPPELDRCIQGLYLYEDRLGKFMKAQSFREALERATPLDPVAVASVPMPEAEEAPAAPMPEAEEAPAAPLLPDGPGVCPNCSTEIRLRSLECTNPKCDAIFGPGSAWKVKPL